MNNRVCVFVFLYIRMVHCQGCTLRGPDLQAMSQHFLQSNLPEGTVSPSCVLKKSLILRFYSYETVIFTVFLERLIGRCGAYYHIYSDVVGHKERDANSSMWDRARFDTGYRKCQQIRDGVRGGSCVIRTRVRSQN